MVYWYSLTSDYGGYNLALILGLILEETKEVLHKIGLITVKKSGNDKVNVSKSKQSNYCIHRDIKKYEIIDYRPRFKNKKGTIK